MSRQPSSGTGARPQPHARPALALVSMLVSGIPVLALLTLGALSKEPPPTVALTRILTMFTIESNVALAVVAWCIHKGRGPGRPGFGPAWNAAVVGALLTGAVAAVWMRPDLDDGVSAFEVADLLLHVVGPLAGLALWLTEGRLDPHVGIRDWRRWAPSLAWPATWTAWVMVLGATSDWYPYRQLDPDDSAALSRWEWLPGIAGLVLVATMLVMTLERWPRRRLSRRGTPAPVPRWTAVPLDEGAPDPQPPESETTWSGARNPGGASSSRETSAHETSRSA